TFVADVLVADRPALSAVFSSTFVSHAVPLVVVVNDDCDPDILRAAAGTGARYCQLMVGVRRRLLLLLSIVELDDNGDPRTREPLPLWKLLPLSCIGNVEGRDLYNGRVDVIVADGFVGNVALKTSEGVANLVRHVLKESLRATITREVGYLLSRSAFADFKK